MCAGTSSSLSDRSTRRRAAGSGDCTGSFCKLSRRSGALHRASRRNVAIRETAVPRRATSSVEGVESDEAGEQDKASGTSAEGHSLTKTLDLLYARHPSTKLRPPARRSGAGGRNPTYTPNQGSRPIRLSRSHGVTVLERSIYQRAKGSRPLCHPRVRAGGRLPTRTCLRPSGRPSVASSRNPPSSRFVKSYDLTFILPLSHANHTAFQSRAGGTSKAHS